MKIAMAQYRIISEPYDKQPQVNARAHRRLRGDDTVDRVVTTVQAASILAAMMESTLGVQNHDHRGRSITSIEEVLPAEALYFSDEELTTALLQPETGTPFGEPEKLDPDTFEQRVIYDTVVFNDAVEEVAKVLRETLLPGLYFTVIGSDDGDQSALVEIRDEATGNYRSTTSAMKDLIQDRAAVGWDGALSIAKALISTVSPLV